MAALEFALLSLVSLLIMINPLSIIPLYVSITSTQSVHESRRFALRASLTALVILLVFALIGQLIFDLFSISLESLRIVGGVLFFLVGYEMLTGQAMNKKQESTESGGGSLDQSITPVGIPLICGPGAISTVMLLMNECHSVSHRALLMVVIFLVVLVTFIVLIFARRVTSLVGETGLNVMMRITGLIVMAIAVEFFIGGLRVIIPRILGP